MYVSAELDDRPPFSRIERKLAAQLQTSTEYGRYSRNIYGTGLVPEQLAITILNRVFEIVARASLTAYHDLRAMTLGELFDDGDEYPPISVGELLGVIDATSYQRRYGNDGGALHG